jgi:hypothetical protein
MKATEPFKEVIQSYLACRAATDELFAPNMSKPGKTIDDCCTYIMNTVKNSGCNGFADDEIFGMAVHYFDEDIIEVGKPITGHVVVNHTISLSETEQAEAKEAAMKKAVAEQLSHLTAKPKVVKKEVVVGDQISLF